MRRRRNSFAWLFLFVGLLLLIGSALAALAFIASQGWLPPEWQWVKVALDQVAERISPGLKFLAWLGGILGSLAGAAFTLLASWHFAEMNLPKRIEDLKNAMIREHLLLQPRFIALARSGLGPVLNNVEASRLMLLRKWLSWGDKERARILAASANQLGKQSSALAAAAREAEEQQITAHLIRGYQYASQGDDEKAFEEFMSATKVRVDNIVSRDIAAGWARRIHKQEKEHELLEEMEQAAIRVQATIDQARAMRRRAELFDKRRREVDWCEARDRLDIAVGILEPLVSDQEAKLELGRALTLYCEVQCERKRIGRLDSRLTDMKSYMAGVTTKTRVEEPDGEAYGEDRANTVERRVAQLRGDPDADGSASSS
jgi:hypothetical protein